MPGKREATRCFTMTMILALSLALPGAAAELQRSETPAARLDVVPLRIDWLPLVAHERLVLTVSGPGDLFIRRVFEAGKAPFLGLFDSGGDRLPDGSYNWELRWVEAPKTREAGEQDAARKLRVAGKPPERPLVASGHFFVNNGSFVAAPEHTSARPPKPPITAKNFVETGSLVVQRNACIGDQCNTSDANFSALKLKSTLPYLLFDDVDIPCEDPPCIDTAHDWALLINPSDVAQFSLRDVDGSLTPFTVAAGAPDNSLYVSSNGNLGLGTSTPAVRLDVKANSSGAAAQRLQNSSATGYSGIEYLNQAGAVISFLGVDNAASTTRLNSINNYPLVILTESAERMRVTSVGDVGIGTASPATQFHIRGTDAGFRNKILVENAGTTNFRELLEIRNNGGATFILKDTSVPQRWAQGTVGANFVIDEQAHAGTEFAFTNTGNLTIAGTLTQGSSRELKTDLASLDAKDVLARVSTLPVSLWSYKTDTAVRHIGPMAEDFHQVFGLGADDKHIAPGDQAGVALLAVQGLNQILKNKAQEISTLQHENADLAKRVATLEALLSTLMGQKGASAQAAPVP